MSQQVSEQDRVYTIIDRFGICGISEIDLRHAVKIKKLTKILNTLRSQRKIFHDLTDGKWKLVCYKEGRKEGDSVEWMSG